MKRFLIVSNVILLAIILIMGYYLYRSGATTGGSASCPANWNDQSDHELTGMISADLIQKMSRAYADDTAKSRISGTDKPDATSLVFDLVKLKNFIWHIESKTCTAGCEPKQELGIRFYYIKYDMSVVPDHLQSDFSANADKHSLAMVPVYRHDDKWYDFDYEHIGAGCVFNSPTAANSGKGGKTSGVIDADNHGGLAPPPDPGYYPQVRVDDPNAAGNPGH